MNVKGNDNFRTPQGLYNQLDRIFNFTLDVACTSDDCKCQKGLYFDKGIDALSCSWGGVFSHGETLKDARESFIYKINNRDTSQYNELTLDSVVTKEEAIKMYRVITGACEFGTKNFVNSLEKVKSKYPIRELIDLTDGRYGSDRFKEFFNK